MLSPQTGRSSHKNSDEQTNAINGLDFIQHAIIKKYFQQN